MTMGAVISMLPAVTPAAVTAPVAAPSGLLLAKVLKLEAGGDTAATMATTPASPGGGGGASVVQADSALATAAKSSRTRLAEQPADARAGHAVHHVEAQGAHGDEDHAEGGRLALRAGDVEGEDAERDHFPAAQREEDGGRGLLDRGDEGEQPAYQDALPHQRHGDVAEGAQLARADVG